ncbi:MAG: hypothetical protein IBX55_01370 [Methyloprofundus sp.]|nr:hypothetical protein [Methyloprofundus sp.]
MASSEELFEVVSLAIKAQDQAKELLERLEGISEQVVENASKLSQWSLAIHDYASRSEEASLKVLEENSELAERMKSDLESLITKQSELFNEGPNKLIESNKEVVGLLGNVSGLRTALMDCSDQLKLGRMDMQDYSLTGNKFSLSLFLIGSFAFSAIGAALGVYLIKLIG